MTSDRVTWSIENAGRAVAFDPSAPVDYVKLAGMTGTGVAPTTVTVTGSASGGGTWRRTARGSRQVTLPVATFGYDRANIESKLRALVRALDDTYTVPLLVATYPDGSTFDVPCHYTGGADQQWGSSDTDGRTYCRWTLQLTCPSPYFTSRTVTQVTVRATAGRGLLRHPGSLSKLRVSASQALGMVTVDNPGDVETYPTWRLQGPGGTFTTARADGTGFTLTGGVQTGNPVTVDTAAKTVRDAGGGNRYGDLAGAPKLFALPPGRSGLRVAFADVGTDALVTLSFPERRELVF